ncbi:MAG TPA: rhodanese-like domain-containing protein, partial [Hyphomicrobiaceae bacterium]|nr:rhodanese-like domain-containing protein [Hyphomicrobiaceae bacterium]
MAQRVDARTLKQWLGEPGEIALLDIREMGPYSQGHPFLAVPLPYSRLEVEIERLVPRRSARLVVFDLKGEGLAETAAKRAEALGYTAVHVLAGGAEGWKAAGYELFDGVNLPSKTFGEIVEIERHTPRITAAELAAMQTRGDDIQIVDGRTIAEYQRFSIPGGVPCPNGELALRIADIVPSPKTKIVVNCAGRTRSIIGAQTLIDWGVPNDVVALENGTQGWFLAGLKREEGATGRMPALPTGAALERAKARAAALLEERGVPTVDARTVERWIGEADRTTYVFDVRTPEEFKADGIAGSVWAEGGQLIQ